MKKSENIVCSHSFRYLLLVLMRIALLVLFGCIDAFEQHFLRLSG